MMWPAAAGGHGHRQLAEVLPRDLDDQVDRFDLRDERQIALPFPSPRRDDPATGLAPRRASSECRARERRPGRKTDPRANGADGAGG